jgi:hypothetical protein
MVTAFLMVLAFVLVVFLVAVGIAIAMSEKAIRTIGDADKEA